MAGEYEEEEGFENDARAATVTGDGMPQGNELTPQILPSQVRYMGPGHEPEFDDDAAATIVLQDFGRAQAWLDNNAWLAEWQYVDYLKQSPNYDRNWRTEGTRAARISRFNVAKNAQTMSTQVRRAIFADRNFFVLEPRGKVAGAKDDKGDPETEQILAAWTELLLELSDRAEFQYNMGLLIASQVLQGTGIGIPGWETRTVVKCSRKRKEPPVEIEMPVGSPKKIDTWASDDFEVIEEEVEESWPFFEYRRLGTTIYDPGWRTPNRPDLSAGYKIDADYVSFEDLAQMRELECYKDIPDDEELKRYFLVTSPIGDAPPASQTAAQMNQNSTVVMHAEGEHVQTTTNPLEKPLLKLAYWTRQRVIEVLLYNGRHKVIRNEPHDLGTHALGYTANWWDIDNCGYGMGTGRLTAGDQRMDQGVLNEVLKMIAYWTNAPLLYDSADGNEPTQQYVMGLGTMWGIKTGNSGDIRKALMYAPKPEIPNAAFDIYKLGKEGAEDLVGANATTMQGAPGAGSTAMRSAAGVNRIGGKADENISDPVANIEGIITRWIQFLWDMVLEVMPIAEIRQILSAKFGKTILEEIDAEAFLNAEFEIKVLAGQKLAAKQAIMQLVPFLLQFLQQPQLLQYLHQIGKSVNFAAIEDLFMRMSELAGRQDILVDLTPQQIELYQQNNPMIAKATADKEREVQKGKDKIAAIQAQGEEDTKLAVLKPTVEVAAQEAAKRLEGSTQLEEAEARLERNTDLNELQTGVE